MVRFHGAARGGKRLDLPVPAGGVRLREHTRDSRLNPPGTPAASARRPRAVVALTAITAALLVMDGIFIAADPTRSTRVNETFSTWNIDKASVTHRVAESGPAAPYSIVVAVVVAALLATSGVLVWRGSTSGRLLLCLLASLGVFGGSMMLLEGTLRPGGVVYAVVMTGLCAATLWLFTLVESRAWFDLRDPWLNRP